MLAPSEDSVALKKKAKHCTDFTRTSSNSCLQDVVGIIFGNHSLMFFSCLSNKAQRIGDVYFSGDHKLPLFHLICVT